MAYYVEVTKNPENQPDEFTPVFNKDGPVVYPSWEAAKRLADYLRAGAEEINFQGYKIKITPAPLQANGEI